MKLYASLVLTEEQIKYVQSQSTEWVEKYVRGKLASRLVEEIAKKMVITRLDMPSKRNDTGEEVRTALFETVIDVEFLTNRSLFGKGGLRWNEGI